VRFPGLGATDCPLQKVAPRASPGVPMRPDWALAQSRLASRRIAVRRGDAAPRTCGGCGVAAPHR
jgi:hypothetical protein